MAPDRYSDLHRSTTWTPQPREAHARQAPLGSHLHCWAQQVSVCARSALAVNHRQRSLFAYRTAPTLFARERHPATAILPSCWRTSWVRAPRQRTIRHTKPIALCHTLPEQPCPTHIRSRKLCFDLILPDSCLAENRRFCVGYCSSFHCFTRNSQSVSFLSPKFELVPFPHLHPAVFFHIR
jgi:hypothetical protein